MTWESRSCNGKHSEGSSVGVVFYGENGSLKIPGGNSYKIYDLDNNIVHEKFDKKIDQEILLIHPNIWILYILKHV